MVMIVSDKLSEKHQSTLEVLVEMVIPASEEYGVPGANDPKIFEDILVVANGSSSDLTAGLNVLDELSITHGGDAFTRLEEKDRLEVIAAFSRSQAQCVKLIVGTVARCYYRDDRVMGALDMEARPPHPDGYTIEQGDWSLLDPVRQRPPFYRQVP